MKNLKRMLSLVMILAMIVSMLPMTVWATDSTDGKVDYSDLTENQYLSMLFTNNNYSGALNKYGVDSEYVPYILMDDYFLDVEKMSRARIIHNKVTATAGYLTTRAIYEVLTFDMDSPELMKLEDYYTAILLSILDTELAGDNFMDAINEDANKMTVNMTKQITQLLESSAELENIDINKISMGDLSAELRQQINLLYIGNMDTKHLCDVLGDTVGVIDDLMSAGACINEGIKNISNFAQLANVSASMSDVLYAIYTNCPDTNLELKIASKRVYEYVSGQMSYEVMALYEAGTTTGKWLASEIMKEAWKGCLTIVCGELAAGVLIGQAIGKAIANFCFATDAVNEQLLVISTMVRFENVMADTVRSMRTAYLQDGSATNADNFMKSLELLLKTYELGCDYVDDFVDTLYTKGAINDIVYKDSEELAEWKTLIAEQKKINLQRRQFLLLETYKGPYEVDAPAGYERYFGKSSGENTIIPITGMNVTQKKELSVGDEGATYNFFSVTYEPTDHTEIALGENVYSSDETVIKADNDSGYIGGYLTAVGEGTCTLTFTSYSMKHSTSVEVTVSKEGTSEPAPAIVASGTCGDNLTWELFSNGTLYIMGTGKMDPYPYSAITPYYTWDRYKDRIKKAVLQKGVTSIGTEAFESCTSLASVTIPNSVTSIGDDAFYSCTSLASVTIPDSVTSIGNYAFYSCTSLASVTIPDSVTSIGDRAFCSCTSLTSVTIPNSVTSVGERAFAYCDSLTSVTIPDSVTSIGSYAFYECTSLTSVTIPNSVTSVSERAFAYCDSLTSVTIPDSVTSIGAAAFCGCDSLTSVTIPNSVTSVGERAFAYCDSLTSVTIPDSVTSIGDYAFYCCDSLTSVYISDLKSWCNIDFGGDGANPLSYGENLYLNGELVTELVIPEGITQIKFYAFCNFDSLTSVTIPEGVTSIGENAFSFCDILTSVTIPEGVTNIGNSAFSGCASLTSATIPEGVTSIGNSAFSGCDSLTSVTIPESVTSIGSSAFSGCSNLWHVLYTGTEEQWNVIDIGNNSALTKAARHYGATGDEVNVCIITEATCLLSLAAVSHCTVCQQTHYTSNNKTKNHQFTNGICSVCGAENIWKYRLEDDGCRIIGYSGAANNVIIPETIEGVPVVAIGSRVFQNCRSLTSVTIPDSVTSIGEDAFYYCYNLNSVHISSLKSWCNIDFGSNYAYPLYYGENLYLNGELVTNLVIPEGITQIKDYAFLNCRSLTSVTIPEGVTSIGSSAFYSCDSLTGVYISSLESWCNIDFGSNYANPLCYGKKLYLNGELVTNLVIPEGIIQIKNYAFRGCDSLTSVTIPESVTSIGEDAFYSCDSLTSLTIPDSVTSVGNHAFAYCSSLTSVTIPGSVTSVGNHAFAYCSSLTSVTIPNSVTSIGDDAFYSCTSLASVTIPDSVTSIGDRAFESCTSLTSVTIPGSVTSIEDNAFNACTRLTSVYISSLESWCNIDFGSGAANPLNYGGKLYLNGKLVTNLVIPEGITQVKDYAFHGCENLTSVIIPEGVTSIGEDAFGGCSSITSVTIPECVTSIANSTFQNCSSLTSVTIPEGVTSIGGYAFSGCTSLTGVTIPESVTSIGDSAFSGCSSLTGVTIPEGVTSIEGHVFQGCSSLTSVIIPAGVTSIDYYAFYDCSSLTSVIIPEGVTCIDNYTFYNCKSLTSVTIPESVTSIRASAFYNCSNLWHVLYTGAEEQWNAITIGSSNSYLQNAVRHYGAVGNEVTGVITREPTCTMEGVKTLSCSICGDNKEHSIAKNSHVGEHQKTVLPSCTASGYDEYLCNACGATYQANQVSSLGHDPVLLQDAVPTCTQGAYHLYHCQRCEQEYTADWVSALGHDLTVLETKTCCTLGIISTNYCARCQQTVYTRKSQTGSHQFVDGCCTVCGVENVWSYSFNSTYGGVVVSGYSGTADAITVPETIEGVPVVGIASNAFYNNTTIKSVRLPQTLQYIGSNAFYNCYNLSYIIIPDGVTNVGRYAFYYCYNLKEIYIPLSVTKIEYSAFEDCDGLSEVLYAGTEEQWNEITVEDYNSDLLNAERKYQIPSGETLACAHVNTEKYEKVPATCTQTGMKAGVFCMDCQYWIRGHEQIPVTHTDENLDHICELCEVTIRRLLRQGYCGSYAQWYLYDDGLLVISGKGAMSNYSYSASSVTGGGIPPYAQTKSGEYGTKVADYFINKVIISEGVTKVGEYAFSNLFALEDVWIAETVTSIGASAFSGCSALDAVELKASITSIGNSAFSGCRKLPSITLPSTITSIGGYTFYNCKYLSDITIPESVTSIGDYAFSGCSDLTKITFLGEAPEFTANCFYGVTAQAVCFDLYPTWTEDVKQNYGGSITWQSHAVKEFTYNGDATCTEDGTKTGVCQDCGELFTKSAPGTATGHNLDGDGRCTNCGKSSEQLIIQQGTCGDNVQWQLYDDGLLIISGEGAMWNYYGWSELFGEPLPPYANSPYNEESFARYIEDYFITRVVVAEGVTQIGTYAFTDLYALEEVSIAESVTTIGASAFSDCTALEQLELPEGITTISSYTFYRCESLTQITLPYTVSSIGRNAFTGCDNLTDVHYSGNQEYWNQISINSGNDALQNATIHVDENFCPHSNKSTYYAIPATCLVDGCTAGEYCRDCQKWLRERELIPALGHLYVDGRCERCNHLLEHDCYDTDKDGLCDMCKQKYGPDYLPGDIDGNDRLTVADVSKLYAHIKRTTLFTDESVIARADVSGDGRLSVADVSMLYAHIRGTKKLF